MSAKTFLKVLKKFFFWDHKVYFVCRHSLHKRTDTYQLFSRIKVYFHVLILKTLQSKTLRNSRHVVVSQLNRESMIYGGKKQRPKCSRNVWLLHFSGLSNKKLTWILHWEGTVSKYRTFVDVWSKIATDLPSNMAAARLAHKPAWRLSAFQCCRLSSPTACESHGMHWERAEDFVPCLCQPGQFFTFQQVCEDGSLDHEPMSPKPHTTKVLSASSCPPFFFKNQMLSE